MSTIQSELGGVQHGLLGISMHQSTYRTVTGREFIRLTCPIQKSHVPLDVSAVKVPRWIQQHVSQVKQWYQMVNAEDILMQQILESLE